MKTYKCIQCNVEFEDRKRSDRIVRFCSRVCAGLSKRNKPSWNKGLPAPWAIGNQHSKGHTPWNKGKHTRMKELNPMWKGGRYITYQGYVYILQPDHPLSNTRGYIPEQILVCEEYLKRHLTKTEVVHHINKIKTDNRPENLFVFSSNADHSKHHMNLRLGKEQSKTSNLLDHTKRS